VRLSAPYDGKMWSVVNPTPAHVVRADVDRAAQIMSLGTLYARLHRRFCSWVVMHIMHQVIFDQLNVF
jgi:hypothetical protein